QREVKRYLAVEVHNRRCRLPRLASLSSRWRVSCRLFHRSGSRLAHHYTPPQRDCDCCTRCRTGWAERPRSRRFTTSRRRFVRSPGTRPVVHWAKCANGRVGYGRRTCFDWISEGRAEHTFFILTVVQARAGKSCRTS